MFVRYSVAAIFALINIVSPSAVPLTKCKADDSKCIKDNAQVLVPIFASGIPELGVETMDPVNFKHIDASNGQLKMVFNDLTLTGLKSCRFKKLSRDAVKHVILAKIHCDVVVKGKYEMKGTILLLPINGKGDVHIEHEKVEINLEMKYKEETGSDGKAHWSVVKSKHTFDYKGRTKMEFTNLFDGNVILGQAVHELIKTSPNEIAKETAGPVIKTIVERIVTNVKSFFDHVPVEEFALD